MTKKVSVGRIVLSIMWVCHIVYFIFGVKTIPEEDDEAFVEKDRTETARKKIHD